VSAIQRIVTTSGVVQSVNGDEGPAVILDAADVGAAPAAHTAATSNPHSVTKSQVGLGNVDNTADADKPVSTATQTALNAKLTAASNLGDVANIVTARANLAVSYGTTAATVAQGNDARFVTVPTTTQAGTSYTLVLADAGTAVEFTNGSAVTVTVPENSDVAFVIGTVIELVRYGAGQVTITPASGVTIRTASSSTTRAQYSVVSLRKRGSDEWILSGDLT
jgi:hypothetical protein